MATKRDIILAVIGTLIAGILFCIGTYRITKAFITGDSYETTDISEYGHYEGHIEKEIEELLHFRSLLMVFPEEIKDSYKVHDFYYKCGSAGFDNMYQLVLDYELPEDEFEAEVERLSRLSVEYEGETNFVIYDTTTFEYPAYVTSFTKNSDYEYALIDEENCRIICILSCVTDINSLPIEKKYLPKDENAYADVEGWYGYSMYHFYNGDSVDNADVIMAEE